VVDREVPVVGLLRGHRELGRHRDPERRGFGDLPLSGPAEARPSKCSADRTPLGAVQRRVTALGTGPDPLRRRLLAAVLLDPNAVLLRVVCRRVFVAAPAPRRRGAAVGTGAAVGLAATGPIRCAIGAVATVR